MTKRSLTIITNAPTGNPTMEMVADATRKLLADAEAEGIEWSDEHVAHLIRDLLTTRPEMPIMLFVPDTGLTFSILPPDLIKDDSYFTDGGRQKVQIIAISDDAQLRRIRKLRDLF